MADTHPPSSSNKGTCQHAQSGDIQFVEIRHCSVNFLIVS